MDIDTKSPQDSGKTQWHTAFFQAIRQELFDYRDFLEFKYNHPLAEEPLRIDVLIIKKPKDLVIDKNIARIFRADNILEYKSPGDYLAVTDFLKVCAYANLYAAVTPGADFADLSLTFVENRHPRNLLKYLREIRGYTVKKTSPGIYRVTGDYLPIQIIESGKLPEEENLWLKSLAKDLQAANAGSIINRVQKSGNRASLGAFLEVLWKENPRAFSEAESMARRKRETFEEVYTKNGVIPGYIEQGRLQGMETAARNAMAKGLPIDLIHDITGLDIKTLEQIAMSS